MGSALLNEGLISHVILTGVMRMVMRRVEMVKRFRAFGMVFE